MDAELRDDREVGILLESDLAGVERYGRGKVRDVYSAGESLLIVATDRISAFDYILATGIPDKGRVLTQLSVFWFDFLKDLTPTHFLTANVDGIPSRCDGSATSSTAARCWSNARG